MDASGSKQVVQSLANLVTNRNFWDTLFWNFYRKIYGRQLAAAAIAMLPQASLQKSLDSQQKSTRSKKNSLDWNFCIEIRSFAWNDSVIYFVSKKPEHHLRVC